MKSQPNISKSNNSPSIKNALSPGGVLLLCFLISTLLIITYVTIYGYNSNAIARIVDRDLQERLSLLPESAGNYLYHHLSLSDSRELSDHYLFAFSDESRRQIASKYIINKALEFINNADNLEEFKARQELIESTGIIVNSPKNLDRY